MSPTNRNADEIRPVFLVGPRGSGKTTVGTFLAARLGLTVQDTDAMVTAEAGRSVAQIVATEGWEGFRERESRALRAATSPGVVIATGGGMVLDKGNREHMRQAGIVIYLAASVETLRARLGGKEPDAQGPLQLAEQRPSLTGADPLWEIAGVLAEREALYRESAHHSVDASAPAARVVAAILRILARQNRSAS